MKKYLFSLIILLSSCQQKMMVSANFSEIDVGVSALQLKESYGKPYAEKILADGQKELEYIEKVGPGNGRIIRINRYFFVIDTATGKIVSKRTVRNDAPTYNLLYDGYDNVAVEDLK